MVMTVSSVSHYVFEVTGSACFYRIMQEIILPHVDKVVNNCDFRGFSTEGRGQPTSGLQAPTYKLDVVWVREMP
jgi:hypothetical protein